VLQGSTLIIEFCDLPRLWMRFGVLLVIKPLVSRLARAYLVRTMRKTMLGKTTIHGTSQIAARIIAERRIHKSRKSDAASPREEGETSSEFIDAQQSVLEEFGLTTEELMAIKDDLSLTGLNFRVLRVKQLRKWRFFSCVAILQAFACFPARTIAPLAWHAPLSVDAFPPLTPNISWSNTTMENLLWERGYFPTFKVPRQSVWIYTDGTFGHLVTANDLRIERETRNITLREELSYGLTCNYGGVRDDGGPWEFAPLPESVEETLRVYFSG